MSELNGKVRILQLRARNVKSVKEVEIDHLGEIVEVRGDSGQGKTTILESIRGALEGLDPSMVRNGESAAEIELRLSEATINRIIPRDGKETLLVKDKNGKPIERAKEFLKTICGAATFRPIAWVQSGGGDGKGKTERQRNQRDTLLKALPIELTKEQVDIALAQFLGPEFVTAMGEVDLAGVDYSQHGLMVCSALQRACYDFRKGQNALVDAAEATLANTPPPDRAAPSIDLAECEARLEKCRKAFYQAQAAAPTARQAERDKLASTIAIEDAELPDPQDLNAAINEQHGSIKILNSAREKTATEVDAARAEIERIEKLLVDARKALYSAEDAQRIAIREQDKAEKRLSDLEDFLERIERNEARKADLAALDKEIAGFDTQALATLEKLLKDAQAVRDARALQDKHDAAAVAAVQARERAERFDRLVSLFRDDLPKALIEQAELPVAGLGVNGDTITINDVPLHQLGTSEQIKVGVAIAEALSPRSGFVLVDGAESLGRGDRLALAEAAKERGLQLILTYVDPDAVPGPGVVVMAGGERVCAA